MECVFLKSRAGLGRIVKPRALSLASQETGGNVEVTPARRQALAEEINSRTGPAEGAQCQEVAKYQIHIWRLGEAEAEP